MTRGRPHFPARENTNMLTMIGHTLAYCLIAVAIALTAGVVVMILRGIYEMMRHWTRMWSIQGVPAMPIAAEEPRDDYSLVDLALLQDLPEEL